MIATLSYALSLSWAVGFSQTMHGKSLTLPSRSTTSFMVGRCAGSCSQQAMTSMRNDSFDKREKKTSVQKEEAQTFGIRKDEQEGREGKVVSVWWWWRCSEWGTSSERKAHHHAMGYTFNVTNQIDGH
jgi:hypothetical protein